MLNALPNYPASLLITDPRGVIGRSTLATAANVRGGLKTRGGTNGPLGRGIITTAAACIVGYTAYAVYKGGDSPAHRRRPPANHHADPGKSLLPLLSMDSDCLNTLEWCMIYGA